MRTMPMGCTASRANENSLSTPSVSLNTHSTMLAGDRHAKPELEAAAEGVPEEAHLLDADVVERELRQSTAWSNVHRSGHREQVGDDDAGPVGEEARHGQVRGRLHAVAVEQHDRGAGADLDVGAAGEPASRPSCNPGVDRESAGPDLEERRHVLELEVGGESHRTGREPVQERRRCRCGRRSAPAPRRGTHGARSRTSGAGRRWDGRPGTRRRPRTAARHGWPSPCRRSPARPARSGTRRSTSHAHNRARRRATAARCGGSPRPRSRAQPSSARRTRSRSGHGQELVAGGCRGAGSLW